MNWQAIAEAYVHPLKLRILQLASATNGERFSPVELAREWGEPLGTVAYHVRDLAAQGFLKRAGSRQARGATEHFYRLPDGGRR